MRVLLVEDDSSQAKNIELMLTSEGYVVDTTDLGEDGFEISKLFDYDIVLLDIMLPDMDGFQVLRKLRGGRIKVPVLVLSALGEPDHKTKALELGAADYLTKPFDKGELIARIQAVVRRSKGHSQSVIRIGRLTVNLMSRSATVDGQSLQLTAKEYAILELLSLRQGSTLSKEIFLSHLYGSHQDPNAKIINVFVCKLRKKLAAALGGESYIETVWGRGYTMAP
ncbi:MAG: response regulator transcription factor [Alphaproteobacteria bacterium]